MTGIIACLASAVPFIPVTSSYNSNGSFTETIPIGASSCVVEVFGASGAGGAGIGAGCAASGGGGGGSGGLSRRTVDVTLGGNKTIAVVVGNGGVATGANGTNSTISSGTFAVTTQTGGFGNGGSTGGGGGAGGTASGGTTNATGNTGGPGAGGSRAGGVGLTGINGSGNSGGTGGTDATQSGFTQGGDGLVIFSYT